MSRLLIILSFVCILANASGKINIKTLTQQNFIYDVDLSTDTIHTVKEKINGENDIPANQYRLIFHGKELGDGDDNQKLSDCNINYGDTVYLFPTKDKNEGKNKNSNNLGNKMDGSGKKMTKDENEGKNKDSNDLGKKMAIAYVIGILVGVSAVLIWHFVTKSVKNNEGENDEEENQSQHAIKENDAVINVKDLKNPNAAEKANQQPNTA